MTVEKAAEPYRGMTKSIGLYKPAYHRIQMAETNGSIAVEVYSNMISLIHYCIILRWITSEIARTWILHWFPGM